MVARRASQLISAGEEISLVSGTRLGPYEIAAGDPGSIRAVLNAVR